MNVQPMPVHVAYVVPMWTSITGLSPCEGPLAVDYQCRGLVAGAQPAMRSAANPLPVGQYMWLDIK